MKKRFINALTLSGAVILGLGGLVACGEDKEKPVTGISISNKEELQAAWKVGETNRQLAFTFEGADVNVGQAIKDGKLKVVSSDTNVVSTLGSYISAVGAGTTTVTATYTNSEDLGGKSFSDLFTLTVTENDSEKEVVEATIKEFKAVEISTDSEGSLVNKNIYKVKGKIKGFGKSESSLTENASDAGTYGNMFLEDESGESLQIYGSTCTNTALAFADGKWKFTNPKDFTSSEFGLSLEVGDEVTMFLIRCDYKGAIEGCGRFVGGPSLIDATEATVEEVINDSNVTISSKLFEVTAEIKGFGSKAGSLTDSVKDGGDKGLFFVTDGKNDLQVYGATENTGAIAWNGSKFKFTNPEDFQKGEITSALQVGDKIKFVCARNDYNGTLEVVAEGITKVSE